MKPKAVIFDCDGVVVDSEPMLFSLLAQDLALYGLPLDHQGMQDNMLGLTLQALREKANGMGARLPEAWCDDFYRRLYLILAEGTPLMPGILTALDALDRAGVPYAIGSNGSLEKLRITLGQHGLIPRFRGLFSGQALGKPKPAPDLYLYAAAELGVAPANCVVVEDSATGAKAARLAGMRCLGYVPRGDLGLGAEGATLFTDMADLPAILSL